MYQPDESGQDGGGNVLMDTMCAKRPAPAMWEAVFVPAQGETGETWMEETPAAQPCACRQAAQKQGSAAGRAVLSARGIQLPSPAPMRSLAGPTRQTAAKKAEIYPIAVVLERAEWR